jgi:hypothetical protein
MKHFLTACLLAFTFFTASAKELPLGAVRLSIGMDQKEALDKLGKLYTAIDQPHMGANSFSIVSGKAPNSTFIGMISFYEGKINWMSRDWGNFTKSSNPNDYGSALFAAIEGATSASGSMVRVDTKVTRAPELEIKQIDFVFSDRKITTLITESRSKNYNSGMSISESVSSK